MRHKALLDYCGITLVLSVPGRNDKEELMTGSSCGGYFSNCVKPLSRYHFDIMTMDEYSSEILLPNTKIVMLMGVDALSIIETEKSISAIRGSPIERDGLIYIATYHPQDAVDKYNWEATNNEHLHALHPDDEGEDEDDEEAEAAAKDKSRTSRSNYRFWFAADIKKAIEITNSGLKRNICTYRLYPPMFEACNHLRATTNSNLFIDIETDPETCIIKCIGFGYDATKIFCVPIFNYKGELCYNKESYVELFKALCWSFKYNTVIAHNSLFDLFILLWKWGLIPPQYDKIKCTMVMHHRCYPSVEKSLGHLISLYTHQIYHKDEGIFYTHNHAQDEQFWLYNAKDVEGLALVYQGITKHASDLNATTSVQQGCESLRVFLTMAFRGCKVDTAKLCQRIDSLDSTAKFFEDKVLPKLVGYKLNPRGHTQVANYLYNELGHKAPPEGQSQTGKKTLYKLLLKSDIPALRLVLYLRRISVESAKLKSKLWCTNRITGSYVVAATKSFRLASRKILSIRGRKDTGWGTNMQNFNKKTKSHIVPDDGYVLMQIDSAGVEAFIVAYLCPPGGQFRQLFIDKIKPHTYVACKLFFTHWCEVLDKNLSDFLNIPISDFRNHKDWSELERAILASDEDIPSCRYYYHAKQTCHSANYDIKANKFVMNILDKSEGEVVIPVKTGERYLNEYHTLFPEIRGGFHSYVRACLEQNMTLVNLFGYPRKFIGQLDDDMLRESYSWIPQSTGSACLVEIAATKIQAKLESGEYDPMNLSLLQEGHDSLLTQVRINHEQWAAKLLTEHMNITLTNPYGEQFTLRSDIQIGKNWKEMEKYKC